MTVVVDTNVVAALMLRTEQNPVVAHCFVRDRDRRLPVLWHSEFLHVLLKYVRANLFSPSQVSALWERALEQLASHEHVVDGQQILALAIRFGCSTYDAEDVVLAKELNCPLLTFDRKLLQLFPDVALKPGS